MTRFRFALTALTVLLPAALAHADPASEKHDRCATRLSIAILGTSPSAALQAATDPQAQVDAMITSDTFNEHFARFINSQFNPEPGATKRDDAVYYLAKLILQSDVAWREMFVGKYTVDLLIPGQQNSGIGAYADPNGLGYFRSPFWLKRYAGNEEIGLRLPSAYRMLQNTVGVVLVPNTNAPGADLSATGRMVSPCNSCHYNGAFALDPIAKVLSRKKVLGGGGTAFTDPPASDLPQTVLGGKIVSSDADVVGALVASDSFRFNTCRLAFKYLFGRAENACEGPVFDKCMQAFPADTGKVQDAIKTIAKDASFCQ